MWATEVVPITAATTDNACGGFTYTLHFASNDTQVDPTVFVMDSSVPDIEIEASDFDTWVKTHQVYIKATLGRTLGKSFSSVQTDPFEIYIDYPCWDNSFIDTQTFQNMQTTVRLGSDVVQTFSPYND